MEKLGLVSAQYVFLFLLYGLVGPRSWFRAAARQPSPRISGLPRRLQRWVEHAACRCRVGLIARLSLIEAWRHQYATRLPDILMGKPY